MKITRSAEVFADQQARKRIANAGCQKCPCCGETKTGLEYLREGYMARESPADWFAKLGLRDGSEPDT